MATDTVDGVETNNAAALSVLENFVDTAANNAVALGIRSLASGALALHGYWVVGGCSFALAANTADSEVSSGAVALALDDVVDFVGWAG